MTGAATPPPSGVVLLAVPGWATNAVHHALTAAVGDVALVLEQPISKRVLLRRRAARLGAVQALGQAAFMATALPVLRRTSRARIQQILDETGLDVSPAGAPAAQVASVNTDEAREVLRALAPRVVVVNGTRIISTATLRSVDAPFLNMHAGITPLYRGVHGAYWALADGRPELAGTTVHQIDAGIDTGPVLAQELVTPGPRDSFVTYPYLQVAAGLPALVDAVRATLAGEPLQPVQPLVRESSLRHHPTLWSYLARRRAGVR